MKRLLLPITLVAVVFGGGLRAQEADANPAVGKPLPELSFDTLQQTGAKSWSEFSGRLVLLEFFAHW